ncbi:GntR family transcriptional regulator [Desulfopila sp. IMCC35008]|uniref:GntR family transcriptional regulator n=1 Tax=Desulfopila sp. IMCC35008 TaxID=2653858 RepID=UPI0013D4EE6D|nr:GntR family transcriptional regulator [Desulfopila sp. IMCC35008]
MSIDRATYKDYVLKHLYTALKENRYRPGDRLTESYIAEELGISRAPIREALAELVSSGLLFHKPQIGTFVASMSPREIIDSYETRGVAEGFAAREAMGFIDEEILSELERMAELMGQYAVKNMQHRLIDIGRDFHETIYGKCDNIAVVQLTDNLRLKIGLLFYRHWGEVYSPDEIRSRHLDIVNVLRLQDPNRVEQVIREHYIETGRKVAAIYNLNSS